MVPGSVDLAPLARDRGGDQSLAIRLPPLNDQLLAFTPSASKSSHWPPKIVFPALKSSDWLLRNPSTPRSPTSSAILTCPRTPRPCIFPPSRSLPPSVLHRLCRGYGRSDEADLQGGSTIPIRRICTAESSVAPRGIDGLGLEATIRITHNWQLDGANALPSRPPLQTRRDFVAFRAQIAGHTSPARIQTQTRGFTRANPSRCTPRPLSQATPQHQPISAASGHQPSTSNSETASPIFAMCGIGSSDAGCSGLTYPRRNVCPPTPIPECSRSSTTAISRARRLQVMLVVGDRGPAQRAKMRPAKSFGQPAMAPARASPVNIHHDPPPTLELPGCKAAAFCGVEVLRGGGDDRHGDAGCRVLLQGHSNRVPFDIPRLPALGPRSAALDMQRIRDPPTRTKTSSCGARVRMSSSVGSVDRGVGVVLVAGQRANTEVTTTPSARCPPRRQIERSDGTGTSKMVEILVGGKGLDFMVVGNVVSEGRPSASPGRPCAESHSP
ncbi:hypothetical protein D9611_001025 [Ephemerocybe angulata]|uniref:Uncharacterized protein n=1 Tax=Ephemerocybe angulata TaxID=980116 RepID=A0A8H5F7K4_9AGAR|nr:hypothetical protein D9611_001025 [Tulosesus angulatus]